MTFTETITITGTTPSYIPESIPDTSKGMPADLKVFDKLFKILEKYVSWDDILSNKIYDWSEEVIANFANKTITKEILDEARDQIEIIRNDILVDPLFKDNPLRNPVLVREWTMEESFLTRYRKQFCQSPFDFKLIEAKTHDLAIEIMAWLDSIPIIFGADQTFSASEDIPESSSTTLTTRTSSTALTTSASISNVELFGILHLAQLAIASEEEKKRQYLAKIITKDVSRVIKETKERIAEEVKKAEERAKTHEEVINTKIKGIEDTHTEQMDAQKKINKNVQDQLDTANTNLADSRKSTIDQQNEVKGLQKEIKDQQHEIEELRKRPPQYITENKVCVIQ